MDMNDLNKTQRKQAVKLADALNAIEGVPVSGYAKTLSQKWEHGEISGTEMKHLLLEYHRQLASAEDSV